jgi:hypothetical protein
MKTKTIKYLTQVLQEMKYYNRLAPFTIYDTELVENLEKLIMVNKPNNKYDEEPVYACMYCDELNIQIHDGVDVCGRCGERDSAILYDTIFDYQLKILKHGKTT